MNERDGRIEWMDGMEWGMVRSSGGEWEGEDGDEDE